MRRALLVLAATALTGTAQAQDASSSDGSMFSRFEVGLGLSGSGPLLFRDTPDAQIEPPSVFAYGTRLTFRFGDPEVDAHRFGLGVGFQSLARSGSRKLGAIDPVLLYATGGATEVQWGLGARVALASDGFSLSDGSTPYTGPLSSLELRRSFIDGEADVPMGFVAGLFAEAALGSPTTFSSVFVGARMDLTFRKH